MSTQTLLRRDQLTIMRDILAFLLQTPDAKITQMLRFLNLSLAQLNEYLDILQALNTIKYKEYIFRKPVPSRKYSITGTGVDLLTIITPYIRKERHE